MFGLVLLIAIALAWLYIVGQAPGMGNRAGTMGLATWAFLGMWAVMVVAMMFPTVGPTGFLRLDEIKDVLDLQRSGQRPCETVIAMLGAHIAEIDRTLSDLTSLRSTLAKACTQARASRDRGDGGVICEIIEAQDGVVEVERTSFSWR